MAVPLSWSVADPRSSSYREFPGTLPLVACTWEGVGGWDRWMRLLPDGCVDIVAEDDRLQVRRPSAVSVSVAIRADACTAGVRLRAGAAGGVLGVAVDQLPADNVSLRDLIGDRVTLWEARLAAEDDLGERRRLLESLVAAEAGEPDSSVLAAVAILARGASVRSAADAAALSTRQLQRRLREASGLAPKALSRVLRFKSFLDCVQDVAQRRTTLARAAAETGYADQSHLSRECVTQTGSSPAALVARWSETFKTSPLRPIRLDQ